jgi:hypothetical protein
MREQIAHGQTHFEQAIYIRGTAALDIQAQRLLLFSTKIRFSPETQPIRDSAVNKLVEQALLLADEPVTVTEIQQQGALYFLEGASALPIRDLDAALLRLHEEQRVIMDETSDPPRFHLVESVKTELWHAEHVAETRYNETINKLFKGVPGGKEKYGTAFLECLCRIFARLGEKYVRHLQRELAPQELFSQPDVQRSFNEIKTKYPAIDISILEKAVYRTFEENDPSFTQLKWNLGQNYYVAKTLGLDPSGRLLSKEIFGNATLYLDTNVLMECLEPSARHYENFQGLAKGCCDLNSTLAVCQISIDELRKAFSRERQTLDKIIEKIPEATQSKVKGVLFTAYKTALRKSDNVNFDELFRAYEEPTTTLKSLYNVQLVDSKWFVDSGNSPDVKKFADALQEAYNRPWKKKTYSAACHDALLLGWIQKERNERGLNAWAVTLDYSLPDFRDSKAEGLKPFAVTLDALIHWMSPMELGNVDKFAEIFSEAIKNHVLPQENFFDTRDFLVFSEMEWASKELPATEVEDCIRHVKATVPHANPTDAKDREKIHREMVKFFADPGRKFKTVVQDAEKKLEEKDHEIAEIRNIADAHQRNAKQLGNDLATEKLRNEAHRRIALMIVLWLALEAAVIELLWYFGEGDSVLQKVEHGWEGLVAMWIAVLVITCFYLGRDRFRALGWPFTKFLKVEEEDLALED